MARTTKRKTEISRAAIYARVSDKSQDGEDKTSISEQIGDMERELYRKVNKTRTKPALRRGIPSTDYRGRAYRGSRPHAHSPSTGIPDVQSPR